MKKWMFCSVAAAFAMMGCSGGGGGSGGGVSENISDGGSGKNSQAVVCEKSMGSVSVMSQETSFDQPQDPFITQGKVLLEGSMLSDDSGALSLPEEASTIVREGTELNVTLNESCQSQGEISASVRSSIPSESDSTSLSGVRTFNWVLPKGMSVTDLQDLAGRDDCVVGISNATEAHVDALPNDPLVAQQGHLKMLQAEASYNLIDAVSIAKPVVIAVIDTGIDLAHEDLKNILWKNSGEIPGNGIDDDKNGYTDDVYGYNFAKRNGNPQYSTAWAGSQHGTHVSGLAAAEGGNAKGGSGVIDRGARIMMLNVFGANSGAASSSIANAIRYAADNGADIINMSIGGSGRNATYESAIAYAISKGATVFAAAGNEKTELSATHFMSPGGYGKQFSGMMTVGSIDSATLKLSSFSNYSPTYVEIGAPGSEDSSARKGLLSTWPGGRYQRIQGTSMSTPVAAGAAAVALTMLRSRGYQPGPATIEGIFDASARPVPDLAGKFRSGNVLDMKKMSDYIEQNYPIGGRSVTGGVPADPGTPNPTCPPVQSQEVSQYETN